MIASPSRTEDLCRSRIAERNDDVGSGGQMTRKTGWGLLAISCCVLGLTAAGREADAAIDRVETFCEIDLAQNNLAQYVQPSELSEGSVFTSDAFKTCIPINPKELFVLTCKTRLQTWSGKLKIRTGVVCEIDGEACGRAQRFTTRASVLTVRSNGDATLRCAVLR